MTTTEQHHEGLSHHEAPEVVHHRQRLGIWIFIAGDVVSMCALLFTYLYLRGTNTGGHWMSIEGVPARGRTMEQIQAFLEEGGSMVVNHESPLSRGLAWSIAAVVVASATALWWGERTYRSRGDRSSLRVGTSGALLLTVTSLALIVMQLRSVPQYWRTEADSQLFIYSAYGSSMLAIGLSALIHGTILVFLGLGILRRTSRSSSAATLGSHATLVRMFWVWVALSTVIITTVVTTLTTVSGS
jgi:heme/copper-type cytochrome/quinol oxidase subunit 3